MTTPQVLVTQSAQATVQVAAGEPAVVEVTAPATAATIEVSVPGPQGPSRASERRHDWSAPYDYIGTAPLGTADNTAAWRITRLTVSTAGAVTATGTATGVTWTGRSGHTYT
jgi:hypothetical protein